VDGFPKFPAAHTIAIHNDAFLSFCHGLEGEGDYMPKLPWRCSHDDI